MPNVTIKQIFNFPTQFIENVHTLPSGKLLLSTFKTPKLLYSLDPTCPDPQAEPVTNFDSSVTGITGIVPLENDLYAVSGGLHTSFGFQKGSMSVFIVSLRTGKIVDTIPVPDTATMNGLATLPHHPLTLVSADSIDGRIISINTHTKEVGILLADTALEPGDWDSASGVPPIGINGLRTRGDYLYFTNSARGTFSRIRFDEKGERLGDFEILARMPATDGIFDDFAFDWDGNAYIATHSSSIVKISPEGARTTIASSESVDVAFKQPTSVALANDGKSIYVVTGGNFAANPREGGQVIQVSL